MIELWIRQQRYADRVLFEDFRLTLRRGELLCLLGPSGCGKTTLLNLIAGLIPDYDGELLRQHCRISYMFQEPRLLPWRTVRQNLALVLHRARYGRIMPLLRELGLADRAEAFPGELSLGMARRVALARSLIVEPDLILMDEPFVSLDPPTARDLYRRVNGIRSARPDTSILLVTHDIREALLLADRILVLGGRPTAVISEYSPPLPRTERSHENLAPMEQALTALL